VESGTIYRVRKLNRRDINKIPTTTVTNEQTDAINGLMIFRSGSVNSPTFGGSGSSGPQFVTLKNNGGTQGSSGTTPAQLLYDGFLTNGTQIFTAIPRADPVGNLWYSPVAPATLGQVVQAWNGQIWTESTTNNASLITADNPGGYSIIWCNETPVEGGC
jgi:hypothetical protein